jgi:anti-repressor protein
MNDLIPIQDRMIHGASLRTVNARDLHAFLGVGSEFRHWIKNRVEQFGFTQDVDFVAGKFLPGSDQIDYHLTLDMAKELSMVERTAKGKEARQYFIECERVAKASTSLALPDFTDPVAAARAWADAKEAERTAQATATKALEHLEAAKPAIEFHERVGDADSLHSIDETAKALQAPPRKFRDALKTQLDLFRKDGLPRQEYLDRGYVRVVETMIRLPQGDKPYPQTFFTGKGLQWIQRRLDHLLMGAEL